MKMKTPFIVLCIAWGVLANPCTASTIDAETSRPLTSTFPLKEKVYIYFSLSSLPVETLPQKLFVEVHNEFGKTLEADTIDVKERDFTYTFEAPSDRLGYYEVHAHLSDGTLISAKGTRPAGLISYAIVPDPSERMDYGDTLSHFGIQGGFNTAALVIPYLGIRYMLVGNDWARMEPDHAGQYAEDRAIADRTGKRHPAKVDAMEQPVFNGKAWTTYHISLITVARIPQWAMKKGTGGYVNKNFGELNEAGEQALPQFAFEQAKAFAKDYRYQEKRYYQITWEPNNGWGYGGTPDGLVKFYKSTYSAIHRADPNAVVVGPTLHNLPECAAQLHELFDHGLGNYLDAVSFHPKPPKWPAEKNGMPDIIRRQMSFANNANKNLVHFIGTEQGLASNEIGALNKAMGDIRTSIMMLGEGADLDIGFYIHDEGGNGKQHGYYWNLNPKIKFGSDKLGPQIIVPAYSAMTYFLDGTTSKGILKDTHGTQLGYLFNKKGLTISAVWDFSGTSTYNTPKGALVCDWMGNCNPAATATTLISGTPTYFIVKNN